MSNEGQTEGSSKGLPAIGSLLGLQRTLAAALNDIGEIADGMRVLPELARILTAIEDRVTSMDSEVRQMRVAVERLNGQVEGLSASVDGMAAPLGEIGHTLHPLRRSASRIGRIGRRGQDAGAEPVPDDS